MSTIKNCDTIYVVESGRVVESGTHQNLLELGGTYYKLWTTQGAGGGTNKGGGNGSKKLGRKGS